VHVKLSIPELLGELDALRTEAPPGARGGHCAARLTRDAARIGVVDGGQARLTTKRASAIVAVAVDEAMATGHLALPNGLGLDHVEGEQRIRTGVGPNEFTASEDRDPWVGTPWHKTIPARLKAIPIVANPARG